MVPIFTGVAQRLSARVPVGILTALGSALFGLGVLIVSLSVGAQPDYVDDFLPGWLIGGVGVGLAFPTIIAAATADLPAERTSTGSAIVSMSRQIGIVLGVSGFVAVLGAPHGFDAVYDGFRHAWWAIVIVSAVAAISAVRMTPSRSR